MRDGGGCRGGRGYCSGGEVIVVGGEVIVQEYPGQGRLLPSLPTL